MSTSGSPPVSGDEPDPSECLLPLLQLESVGTNRWRANTPEGDSRPTLYGGIVAAQALRAGHLSAGIDRPPHSLHAYFLRSGLTGEPIDLAVDATRDGRSFSARRIEVSQRGQPILTMIASFHIPEVGDNYQVAPSGLPPPGPDTPTEGTAQGTGTAGAGPFAIVDAPAGAAVPGSLDWSLDRYWVRAREQLPEDLGIQACALVAMGDLRTAHPPRLASEQDWPLQMTSLDYAMWFHRATLATDWLCFDLRASGNGGARGLTFGVVHDAEGSQVATFTMELLLRRHRATTD